MVRWRGLSWFSGSCQYSETERREEPKADGGDRLNSGAHRPVTAAKENSPKGCGA